MDKPYRGSRVHPRGRPPAPLEPLNDADFVRARQDRDAEACDALLERLCEAHPERDNGKRT